MPIVISANSTSATIAKTTPGPGEPRAAQAALEGDAGQDHADRRDRRAERLEGRQRLAADRTTESTTVSPPYAATMPLTTEIGPIRRPGEVGQVRAGAGKPDERPPMPAPSGRSAAPCRVRSARPPDQVGPDQLHPGGHPEAADAPAGQRGEDVERAPGERGTESGQEADGHRRSLAAGRERGPSSLRHRDGGSRAVGPRGRPMRRARPSVGM